MIIGDEKELITYLSKHNEYKKCCDTTSKFPKPYCANKKKVKAIVLGTDPSNRKYEKMDFVFGLENKSSAYFRSTLKNLNTVGIEIEDLYIQNVCRNYFYKMEKDKKIGLDTDKNKNWVKVADMWVPLLKKELDNLFDKDVPVFITALKIMKVLCYKEIKPKDSYENVKFIQRTENKLDRLIIPLYRGGYGERSYQIDNPKWSKYKERITKQFKND